MNLSKKGGIKMKASVQDNDFIGTAAADINDWIRLDEDLKQKGVDIFDKHIE